MGGAAVRTACAGRAGRVAATWRARLLTAAGSLIWNTIFVLAGYLLGENWHVIEQYADILKYVVIVGVAVGVAWFMYARIRSLLASRRDA